MIGPGVSVIIPNWNGSARLDALLTGLREQTPIEEVIVVDNGSTDDSVLAARRAGARVISNDHNAGFAAAVNQGAREARADWLAILNNDVELGPTWLATLLSAAIGHSAAFATGKLLDSVSRDRIDGTWDAVCRAGTSWRCGSGMLDGPAFSRERIINFAPFTALLIARSAFERVGGLDESFESYLEDVDFGLRSAKAGVTGIYEPDAVAYHHGSATLGRWHSETTRRISRNQVLLVAKHFPSGHAWAIFVGQALWGLLAVRHGHGWSWLKGKVEGVWRFQSLRGSPVCASVLEESEQQIRELRPTDFYWKAYFLLT